MKVELIMYTQAAAELLMFTKDTRLLNSGEDFNKKFNIQGEDREKELKKIFSTISSPLEFVDYIFLITGVTRAFTHQLVRHRVGVSFAQQSQRVADMSDFGCTVPDKILKDDELTEIFCYTIEDVREGYRKLIENGADQQDARGVLPTNVHTNILMKINLRALLESAHIRLCVRAQGEFQQVMFKMMEAVGEAHPWAAERMGPMCIAKGICAFPLFDRCPIKANRQWLNGPHETVIAAMRGEWKGLMGKYCPQPIGGGK